MRALAVLVASFVSLPAAWAAPPPAAPTDPNHPGSKIYAYGAATRSLTCEGRKVSLVLPTGGNAGETFPVVVYGHGQALEINVYRATFEHLAKKGVVFPAYDNGFFDQDWNRMGRDYGALAACAISQAPELDARRVVFSGHSKGAYVASIAAGLNPPVPPRAIVLFEPAGADTATLPRIPSDTALTVIWGERDTTVSRDLSETIYAKAGSQRRQLIVARSYNTTPAVVADHMWPLTEKTFFGGGPESALHYYGAWKWLVAAARDLSEDTRFGDPFLYGAPALDKGVPGAADDVKRSW